MGNIKDELLMGRDSDKEKMAVLLDNKPVDIKWTKKMEQDMGKIRKEAGLDELEKIEQDLIKNNPKMEMYCLCCGRLVNNNYYGELWDSMCMCKLTQLSNDEMKELFKEENKGKYNELHNHMAHTKCVKIVEGPKKGTWKMMLSMSFLGDFAHSKCSSCKSFEEHTERKIQDYLGKEWKSITPKIKEVYELRKDFIKQVKEKCIEDEETCYQRSGHKK